MAQEPNNRFTHSSAPVKFHCFLNQLEPPADLLPRNIPGNTRSFLNGRPAFRSDEGYQLRRLIWNDYINLHTRYPGAAVVRFRKSKQGRNFTGDLTWTIQLHNVHNARARNHDTKVLARLRLTKQREFPFHRTSSEAGAFSMENEFSKCCGKRQIFARRLLLSPLSTPQLRLRLFRSSTSRHVFVVHVIGTVIQR